MSYLRYSILIVALLIAGGLVSQTPPATTPTSQPQPTTEPAPAGPGKAIQLQEFDPIAVKDPRFVVSNVNFDRRYAPNGVGEFLDVVFDIRNLTSQPVELTAYVMAFWETDAVDRNSRRLIPYPTWRTNDPARSDFMVHYITMTPRDIPPTEIWSDQDKDYKHYAHIADSIRNSVATTEPIADPLPPFWKYLSYISERPTQGLKFTLFGEKGPGQNEVIQTNYVPQTAEEKKKKIHRTLSQHKYTLEHIRRMTTFRSHHYSEYRAGYRYFNTVSIVLFDAKRAAEYEAQLKAGRKPGEARVDALVFKQTYRVPRDLKL